MAGPRHNNMAGMDHAGENLALHSDIDVLHGYEGDSGETGKFGNGRESNNRNELYIGKMDRMAGPEVAAVSVLFSDLSYDHRRTKMALPGGGAEFINDENNPKYELGDGRETAEVNQDGGDRSFLPIVLS